MCVEVGGMSHVAVKCIDMTQNTDCEGSLLKHVTDAEGRKRGERTGLDTLVVHAVNDDNSLLAIHIVSGQAKALSYPPGEYARQRVKLKGIDGGPHKRWSMWFNSMIREEPYQGLNAECT